jgi:hypothetical protein
LLFEGLLDGRRTTAFATVLQCPVQIDDRLFNRVRSFAWMAPRPSALFLRPRGIVSLVARFPLKEPTFRARHLAADILDLVPGKISRHRLVSALFLRVGHSGLLLRLTLLMATCHLFSMSWHNICSRCHIDGS